MNIGDLVLYKNNQLIAFNKPAGIPVQADKTKDKSLLDLAEIYTKSKLHLIHRIDRPASGIVLFAKNKSALSHLSEQFKARTTKKLYLAVVPNQPSEPKGQLIHHLKKNGKTNRSQVVNAEINGAKQLLTISLQTGRHHQIRAQLAAIKNPIKGDVKYGFRRGNKDRSIHLHSWKLSFEHPVSKEIVQLTAPIPEEVVWQAFQIPSSDLVIE